MICLCYPHKPVNTTLNLNIAKFSPLSNLPLSRQPPAFDILCKFKMILVLHQLQIMSKTIHLSLDNDDDGDNDAHDVVLMIIMIKLMTMIPHAPNISSYHTIHGFVHTILLPYYYHTTILYTRPNLPSSPLPSHFTSPLPYSPHLFTIYI